MTKPMKTYIALVRHGVTDWNYDARAQGQTDIPLNREGQNQAERLAARLSTERWDAIYSSDLSRAFVTAQAVARHTGHEVITDVRLRERRMGLIEGSTEAERRVRWPKLDRDGVPGRESDEELSGRARDALNQIAERHRGQRILIVSHGSLIAVFLRGIDPGPNRIMVPRNTGVTPVLYDGERFTINGPQSFDHLLVDGVEYSAEKWRAMHGAAASELPNLPLAPDEMDPFILNASAVETAWVNDRLVGFARAFTDRVRHGYVDVMSTLPGFERVRPVLLQRLQERFPGVRFTQLGAAPETAPKPREESEPA